MRFLIALLAVAGIVVSSRALQIHMQDPSVAPPCAVTEHWDCGAVNHSRFADFPPKSFDEDLAAHKIHVPVALLGILGYTLILGLTLANRLWLTLQAAEICFAFAAFLSYLEAFVIEKWCIYCVWSQAIVTAVLVATIVALILERRKSRFAHSAVVVSE
jgi:vitamin-K-epoxide reductase (warfarin-sensitive)